MILVFFHKLLSVQRFMLAYILKPGNGTLFRGLKVTTT